MLCELKWKTFYDESHSNEHMSEDYSTRRFHRHRETIVRNFIQILNENSKLDEWQTQKIVETDEKREKESWSSRYCELIWKTDEDATSKIEVENARKHDHDDWSNENNFISIDLSIDFSINWESLVSIFNFLRRFLFLSFILLSAVCLSAVYLSTIHLGNWYMDTPFNRWTPCFG